MYGSNRRRSLAGCAALASLAVVVAGCGSSKKSASSQSIKVGVAIGDTASLAQAGLALKGAPSADAVKLMWTSAINAVNATDKLKLTPDFQVFNLIQAAAPQTACAHFIQDSKDFAVLSAQFVNGGDQCVAQRGGIMLQAVAAPQTAYDLKTGAVYTTDMAPNEAATEFADYLQTTGELKGQKVGVLTDALGGDAAPVNSLLVPALKKAGVNVVHVTTLTADLTQVAQQVPIEINAMKSAGVTTIVDATPAPNLLQFMGGMAKQGWSAKFVTSDLNDSNDEVFASLFPPTFDGSTTVTSRDYSSTPSTAAAACLSDYVKAGGQNYAADTTNGDQVLEACSVVDLLAAGVKKTKGALNLKNFDSAMSSVGSIELPYYGPSSVSGSEHSSASTVSVDSWKNGGWQVASSQSWTKIASTS